MATTKGSIDQLKQDVRAAYTDGRELGMDHRESLMRAEAMVGGLPSVTVKEWCDVAKRQADREEV